MRKLSLILLLLINYSVSYSQTLPRPQIVPTGGCAQDYDMSINNITQNGSTVFVMVNKQKYSLSVTVIPANTDCPGELAAVLTNKVAARTIGLFSPVTNGTYIMPLDTFTLPVGVYDLTVTFRSYTSPKVVTKVSIVATTGVGEINHDNGISIFPIPANDMLTIDGANFKESINEIRMTDMAGRQVKSAHSVYGYNTNYTGDRFACGHLLASIADKNRDIK